MANKQSFTADEWSQVLSAPIVASLAISAAEPSGLWGLMKEGMANGWTMLEAKNDPNADSLVKAVAEDFMTPAGRDAARARLDSFKASGDAATMKKNALVALANAAAIVRAKAPEDAAAFSAWVKGAAQKTAEAGTEGGFLGFGGVKVSETEKATLAEIDAALAG